mmetsp:Transcript_16432/g.40081  ORF Transcript_16432/g.40081 Transcript_16432/m.40081 type:complete len:203 (-) Transcript_16432:1187-1795(-)
MLLRRCLPHDRRNHPHHLLHLYRRILQLPCHHPNQLLYLHLVRRIQEKQLILLNGRHRILHHCRLHNLRLFLQDHRLIHQPQYQQINPYKSRPHDQVWYRLHVQPVKVKQQIRHNGQHLHRLLDQVYLPRLTRQHNDLHQFLHNHLPHCLRQDLVFHQLPALPILEKLPYRLQHRRKHQLPRQPILEKLPYLLNSPRRRFQH